MRNLFKEVLYGCFVLTLIGGVWSVGWSQSLDRASNTQYLPGDAELAKRLAQITPDIADPDEELGDFVIEN